MDYDWLGMKSKQHLTTELIETRLTKGYSFRWNWRNGEEEMSVYLSKDSENIFPLCLQELSESF